MLDVFEEAWRAERELPRAFDIACRRFAALSVDLQGDPDDSGGGPAGTLLVAHKTDHAVDVVGISDAQLLVTRKDRVLHRTSPQTIGEEVRKMGQDPRAHPHSHILMQTISPTTPAPTPRSATFEVQQGDRIIVASSEPSAFPFDEDLRVHANHVLAAIDNEYFAFAVVEPVT